MFALVIAAASVSASVIVPLNVADNLIGVLNATQDDLFVNEIYKWISVNS